MDQARSWAASVDARIDIVDEVAPLYWELAARLGLRPEVAFAQAMVETANFRFPRCGVTVCPDFCNPCGMRTRDLGANEGETPDNHQRFVSWREGVQAHLDHLGLYLQLPGYPKPQTPGPSTLPVPARQGRVADQPRRLLGQGRGGGRPRVRREHQGADRPRCGATAGGTGATEIVQPTPERDEFDMATIADLEDGPSQRPEGTAAATGTTGFDETIQDDARRRPGRPLQRPRRAVRNSLDNAVGDGTLSFAETIRMMLAVVQGSHNDIQELKGKVAELEARLASG